MTRMRTTGRWKHLLLLPFLGGIGHVSAAEAPKRDLSVLIVVGAHGNDEYRKHFTDEAALLEKVCTKAGAAGEVIGMQPEDEKAPDSAKLKNAIESVAAKPGRA